MINKTSFFKRIASTVIALPIYLFCIASDSLYSLPLLIISMTVSLGCLYEFYQISSVDNEKKPFTTLGIAAGVFINLLIYIFSFGKVYGLNKYIEQYDARYILAILVIFVIILSITHLLNRQTRGSIYSLAVTVFGVIFIVVPFSHIMLIKSLKHGFYFILLVHIVIFCNDTFAYFFGSFFGKHNANIPFSPNKTWKVIFQDCFSASYQ